MRIFSPFKGPLKKLAIVMIILVLISAADAHNIFNAVIQHLDVAFGLHIPKLH